MTEEQNIMLFNRHSNWTYKDWMFSEARRLLLSIPKKVVEWICEGSMTDEEKKANPTYKTTGGYLKVLDESECAQMWWDNLPEESRNIVRNIPNFDATIFEQCTGIKTK